MSFFEKAQAAWPGVDGDTLQYLLFETTAFPFGTEDQILSQLRLNFSTHAGDVDSAITSAHKEIALIARSNANG